MKMFFAIFLIFLLLPGNATGADDADLMYVKVTPGLVLNFGEPSLSRLRYLKVAVHIQVEKGDVEVVEQHIPALQDALVMLLSAQDEETVGSGEGKEEIRMSVLKAFQKIMKKEADGEKIVLEVLFAAFIVQR